VGVTALTDTEAPSTSGGANEIEPGVAEVQLAATDVGAAGVASTLYSVDGGHSARYVGTFRAPLGATIHFRSVDRAGNWEEPRTLAVDDASDERAFALVLSSGANVARFLDHPGDVD
jgi:hypothetical protein